jgi:ankyrin repeat protein
MLNMRRRAESLFTSNEASVSLLKLVKTERYNDELPGKIDSLIEQGADINTKDEEGNTLLALALLSYNYDLVPILIEQGADVNMPNGKYNTTPLMFMMSRNNPRIVKTLIEAGAKVDEKDDHGMTCLALGASSGVCNMQTMKLLIEKAVGVDEKDHDGKTPIMHILNYFGRLEPDVGKSIISLLIEKGVKLNEKDNDGKTPLMYAVSTINLDIISFLIEKGARIDEKDNNGKTPFMYAVSALYVDDANVGPIITFLIEKGARIDEKDNNGKTPLMLAASTANLNIISLLIEKGAILNEKDNNGKTPLMLAASTVNLNIISLLIEKGAILNEKDNYGKTPLMHAMSSLRAMSSRHANTKAISLLIEKGADIQHFSLEEKQYLMGQTLKENNFHGVITLLNNNIDIDANAVENSKDRYLLATLLFCHSKTPDNIKESCKKYADPIIKIIKNGQFHTFLLGKHPRVGAENPNNLLYQDVLEIVCESLEESSQETLDPKKILEILDSPSESCKSIQAQLANLKISSR